MFLSRIQSTLSGAGLPGAARYVTVAVSGGADSTAVALALHRLWAPQGIRLHLVHIDHTLPEAESPGDAEVVRKLAEQLGATFANRVVDVRAAMAATGESLEMAARNLRHAALRAAAAEAGADLLALGHNADDQVETLFLRLARGTGPRGLGGMAPAEPPSADGGPRVIRPLLDCPREDIRDWLRAEGVGWLDDPTNDADDVQRNRLRHRVLPALYDALGPATRDGILRTMALLRDEERDWLSHAVREAFAQTSVGHPCYPCHPCETSRVAAGAEESVASVPSVSVSGAAAGDTAASVGHPCYPCHPCETSRAAAGAEESVASVPSVSVSGAAAGDTAASVGHPCYPCHPCETSRAAAGDTAASVGHPCHPCETSRAAASAVLRCPALSALPYPLARRVCLVAMQEAGVPAALQTLATVERIRALAAEPTCGTLRLDLGAGFRAERVYDTLRIVDGARPPVSPAPASRLIAKSATGFLRPKRGNPLARPASASVSREAVPDPARLAVRLTQPGDRMTPLGAAGSRTIADILVDRKIPAADRASVEVVCLDDRLVWLPGHAVDAAFAVPSVSAPSWTLTLLAEGAPS